MKASKLALCGMLTAAIAAGCQPPVSPMLVAPLVGRYDFPSRFRTATPTLGDQVTEMQSGATVSLIDPGSNLASPLDDVVVASTVTGTSAPNFQLAFGVAPAAKPYFLEVYKFRAAAGAPLSMRTVVSFNGTNWRTISDGTLIVNPNTSALAALATYDAGVSLASLIDKLDGTGATLQATTFGSYSATQVQALAQSIRTSLITNADPLDGTVLLDRLNAATPASDAAYEVTPGITRLQLIASGLDTIDGASNRVVFGPTANPETTSMQALPSAVATGAMGGTREQLTVEIPTTLAGGNYGLGIARGGAQSNRLPIQALTPNTVGQGTPNAGVLLKNGTQVMAVWSDTNRFPRFGELAYDATTKTYSLANQVAIDNSPGLGTLDARISGGTIYVLASYFKFNAVTFTFDMSLKYYARPVSGGAWTTTTLATNSTNTYDGPHLFSDSGGTLYGTWVEGTAIKLARWPNPETPGNVVSFTPASAPSVASLIEYGGQLHVIWTSTAQRLWDTPIVFGSAPGAARALTAVADQVGSFAVKLSPGGAAGVAWSGKLAGVGQARAFYGVITAGAGTLTFDELFDAPLAFCDKIVLDYDADGLPFVAMTNGNAHILLYLARRLNLTDPLGGLGHWSALQQVGGAEPAWMTVLADGNRHHLFWIDEHAPQNLYYLPLVWR